MKSWVLLLVLSIIGGLIGAWSGVPVGGLLGALLFVSIAQLFTAKLPKFPAKGKRIIQILLGGNIGLSFSSDSLTIIQDVWFSMLIIPVIQLAIGLLIGFILIRFLKFNYATALCSAVPSGISEITFIAETYNANIPFVITIHILRVFFIVFVIPFAVMLFL
ncbi:AbrB family transcriptional regulator [Anaerobacillus sp. MEB173]|uniref:AbrB family transcriptional regulator n=1 Tax=Anaerobacillus sp. MEB173 TaxID=3383345 RepID=UPI003F902229